MFELDRLAEVWKVDTSQPAPIHLPEISRVDLAIMFNTLGYATGAEIGVYRGDYSYSLCKHNPQAQVYCIDAWLPYNNHGSYREQQENMKYTEQRLGCFTNANVIQSTSIDALDRFADGALDFVYIDANHTFPHIATDLFYWSQKVRSGGIVSGHDYLPNPRPDGLCQVREVVTAYAEAFNIHNWFTLGTPTKALNWMWVKP